MNAYTPKLGTDAVYSLPNIKARIAQWCAWFDLPVPELRPCRNDVEADAVITWCLEVDVSIDWIARGDIAPLATSHRKLHQLKRHCLAGVAI